MTPSTHATSTKMQRILYASWSCWLPPRVLLPIWFPQLTWMPQLAAAESPPASRWPWSTQENLGHLIKVLIYWKHQMVPPPCSRIDRHHMHWPHTRIYPGYQNKMWKKIRRLGIKAYFIGKDSQDSMVLAAERKKNEASGTKTTLLISPI